MAGVTQGLLGTEHPACVEAGIAVFNTNSKITLSIPSSESRVHPDIQGEPYQDGVGRGM